MKTRAIFLIVLVVLSCKGNPEADVKTAPTHSEPVAKEETPQKDLNKTSSTSEVTFNDQTYNTLYDTYLDVKGALVNTNGKVAQEKAVALSQAVEKVTDISDTTREAIKTMISESDVKKQRAAFEIVSQDLEVVLSKNVASGTIYKQYCPMAFNGKGAYWLSDSKEVRNPYFGDQMLTCGVVDSKIE